jgi:hypothetical protein
LLLEDSFKPFEVLNATVCLFTALRDAHLLNIGIVDLKLENFLVSFVISIKDNKNRDIDGILN